MVFDLMYERDIVFIFRGAISMREGVNEVFAQSQLLYVRIKICSNQSV